MPWNPFKKKKDKESITPGFHPIDLDALGEAPTPASQRGDKEGGKDKNVKKGPAGAVGGGEKDCVDSPSGGKGYGRDGLLSAAFKGDEEALKRMLALESTVKMHRVDSLGNTPLHLAAFSGHLEVVKLLLSSVSVWHDFADDPKPVSVNVRAKNEEADTPLYMAVLSNNLSIVKMLAEASDKQVNLKNVEGFSPLHYSAGEGNLEITKYLVEECGALPSAEDNLGLTPCFCAVLQGRLEVALYLLDREPKSVLSVNSMKDSMLHCAIKGYEAEPTMKDIIKALLAHEAPLDTPGSQPDRYTCRQLLQMQGLTSMIPSDSAPPPPNDSEPPPESAPSLEVETKDTPKNSEPKFSEMLASQTPLFAKAYIKEVIAALKEREEEEDDDGEKGGGSGPTYGMPRPPTVPEAVHSLV